MKFQDTWNISIDDEYREYLNLGVCILVIFILGAISLPIFKDYIYKSKMLEMYYTMQEYKNMTHEYYGEKHKLPPTEKVQEFVENSDFMSEGSYTKIERDEAYLKDGMFVVTFKSDNPEINGKSLSIRPIVDENRGTIIWLCGYTTYINDDINGFKHLTTLPKKFLAGACKD